VILKETKQIIICTHYAPREYAGLLGSELNLQKVEAETAGKWKLYFEGEKGFTF